MAIIANAEVKTCVEAWSGEVSTWATSIHYR